MVRRDSWETGTPGAAPHPHTRAALLSEVSTDGVLAITRALRGADHGDETAAQAPVSALLRALPGVGPLTAHELLRIAGIGEEQQIQELRPRQRAALLQIMGRLTAVPHGG